MRETLLKLARDNIRTYLETGRGLTIEAPADSTLREKRAVFVTLEKDGELRGCIGQMVARDPLYKAVLEMSLAAAFEDPRFHPVRKGELDSIRIEISVLTPMQSIDDWRKIRLGIDGVYLRKGFRSGVFLPQVATETGWDLETFLRHLCSGKAGLPSDAYKDRDVDLQIFQVEKFVEGK
jgi:AmmeMemoRadiSam system protein A